MTFTGKLISTIALCGAIFGTTAVSAGHHESGESTAQPTIVEIAVGNPDFSTLVAALQAAELVDSAGVVTTDIEGSNGVIHAINAVILPKS